MVAPLITYFFWNRGWRNRTRLQAPRFINITNHLPQWLLSLALTLFFVNFPQFVIPNKDRIHMNSYAWKLRSPGDMNSSFLILMYEFIGHRVYEFIQIYEFIGLRVYEFILFNVWIHIWRGDVSLWRHLTHQRSISFFPRPIRVCSAAPTS